MGKTARRDAGSGSVFQRHEKRYGCPPIEIVDTPDGPQKMRPKHNCRAPWVAMVELGWEKGKRRRKIISGKDKPDAVAKLKAFREKQARTGATVAATNLPKLDAWLARWIKDIAPLTRKPKTLTSYRSEIDNHIVPFLGHRRVDEIEPLHLLEWHKKLRKEPVARPKRGPDGKPIPETLAESSVLKAHAVLSTALADARTYLRTTENPARIADRPGKKPKRPRRPLELDEALTALRAAVRDPMGSRWAASIMLGTRQGETLGMQRSHIDLKVNWIDLSWQLQRLPYVHGCPEDQPCGRRFAGDCVTARKGKDGEPVLVSSGRIEVASDHEWEPITGGLCLTRPKGEKTREFPMPPILLIWLRKEFADNPGQRFAWSRPDGRPIDPRDDRDAWKEFLEKAGLPLNLEMHANRHTTATLLQRLGVPEATRMAILGHTVVTTHRGYAHVDRELMVEAMGKLGDVLELKESDLRPALAPAD